MKRAMQARLQSEQSGEIADGLAGPGYVIVPNFLSDEIIDALAQDARTKRSAGAFKPAAVGKGESRQLQHGVRTDAILWLDQPRHAAQFAYQAAIEKLRLEINCSLALGLFEHEAHYSSYFPGDFYRRHRDQFVADSSRQVSTVLYLNPCWRAEDGGTLRLYLASCVEGGAKREEWIDVFPTAGTLVVFRSADFDHEVLPTRRERLSIAGWFRRRM